MKSGQSHLLKGVTISKIYINSPALNAVCIIWVKVLPYKSGVEVRKQSELSPDKTDLIQKMQQYVYRVDLWWEGS